MPEPFLVESWNLAKHVFWLGECPAGCPYCARSAAKAAKKKEIVRPLEQLCLEAIYELGEDAASFKATSVFVSSPAKNRMSHPFILLLNGSGTMALSDPVVFRKGLTVGRPGIFVALNPPG